MAPEWAQGGDVPSADIHREIILDRAAPGVIRRIPSPVDILTPR
jgi:hypothetical protein